MKRRRALLQATVAGCGRQDAPGAPANQLQGRLVLVIRAFARKAQSTLRIGALCEKNLVQRVAPVGTAQHAGW